MWTKSLTAKVIDFRSRRSVLPTEQVEALTRIGFIFHVAESDWDERNYPAFQQYKRIYGDLDVPQSFTVKTTALWPAPMRGIRLGRITNGLRVNQEGLDPSKVAQLNALGMIWSVSEHTFMGLILPSMQMFHAEEGTLKMKQGFTVPRTIYYPDSCWDFPLGRTLQHMRCKNTFHTQVKKYAGEMTRMGFEYPTATAASTFSSMEEEELIRGLSIHKQLVGHTLVRENFDPSSVQGWTEEDLPLGKLVKKARKLHKTDRLTVDMIQRLSDHGMVWKMTAFKTKILPALHKYQELHGNLDIPQSFGQQRRGVTPWDGKYLNCVVVGRSRWIKRISGFWSY